MLTEEMRIELERFQEQLKESLKDIDVANLSKEDAKKIYYKIDSKVSEVLGMDYYFPEPGALKYYGERLVDKIMSNVGLRYMIEDFLPRYQQESETYTYQNPDDLPPQK